MLKRQKSTSLFNRLNGHALVMLHGIDKKRWNIFNLLISLTSWPSIGIPIKITNNSLRLKAAEYKISEMPKHLFDQFSAFCYPSEMHNREKEIEIDEKHYWPFASVFLVFYDNVIVCCLLYLIRDKNMPLPVEFGRVKTENTNEGNFNIEKDIGMKRAAEIYRFRRSFTVRDELILPMTAMIFRAVWAKTIQTGTEYMYCSCDSNDKELTNLYSNRLLFEDTGRSLYYKNNNENWVIFRKDSYKHELDFAAKSFKHFIIQLSTRRNLVQIVFNKYPGKIINAIIYLRKKVYDIQSFLIKIWFQRERRVNRGCTSCIPNNITRMPGGFFPRPGPLK